MTLANFKTGDILLMTTRMKKGEEVRAAQVYFINYNGLGLVTFGDYYLEGYLPSGQGAFDPQKINERPFGLIKVEVIGNKSLPWENRWYPRPGDRGYDLM